MEMRLREFQLIEINRSIIERYSHRAHADDLQHRKEESVEYLKLEHLKYESLKAVKKVEKKLQIRPYFLKSKTIREDVGREAYIKSEYSDRWETYKNTNRVNLSKFLKDMLPYVNKNAIKRLKHGRYFRSIVDGMMNNDALLDLAGTPNAYAVVNPRKTRDFFTEDIVKDLGKKFEKKELVDMTKDEEWIAEILEEDQNNDSKTYTNRRYRGRIDPIDFKSRFYYCQSSF